MTRAGASIEIDLHAERGSFALEMACTLERPVTGIFGASGAGKTTLLHALAGLVRPRRGRIAIGGRVLFDSEAGIFVPVHERRVGLVFQEDRLFPHYSVRGNLTYARRAAGGDGLRPRLPDIVELLELGPLLERRPSGLSGGERRRVALGRCLLSGPALLLLDEPLSGLDDARRRQILPFLHRVRDEVGVPMLYVTHDLPEMLRMTGELVVLEGGRLAGAGRYIDLAHREASLGALHHLGLVNVLEIDPAAPLLVTAGSPAGPVEAAGATGATGRYTVAIRPEDVALSPEPVPAISIRNQVPGRVTRLTPSGASVIVEVDIGQPLLVEVTPAAVEALALDVGRPVHCLIKASAIRVL